MKHILIFILLNNFFVLNFTATKVPVYHVKGLINQDKFVYFDPRPSMAIYSSIACLVDPSTTYVHNREHRYYRNHSYYQGSEILLKDYLENLEKAEQLRKTLMQDGSIVILDHITSEPKVLTLEDQSRSITLQEKNCDSIHTTRLNEYLPEVIIETQCIQPEQLIFLSKNATA